MQQPDYAWIPLLVGVLCGMAALGACLYAARQILTQSRDQARDLLADAESEAEDKRKEILVAAQEKALALQEDADRRHRELEDRESGTEQRARELDNLASEQGRQTSQLERRRVEFDRREAALGKKEAETAEAREAARENLERVAGLSQEEARQELIAGIEAEARANAARVARKIEDESRQNAEREARNLIVRATQRVNIRDVMESTVSFIELPDDEMKGRIIGKEGRNIRALEMATGIDLIVDDTPRSIWISCFDPVRREIARVAIDRLLEDGRIHPARIEEVVEKVGQEIEPIIEEKGNEAAFQLEITDLHPRLIRLVGRTRFHTSHGHNLMQHVLETAMIAGFMAQELGASVQIARRSGLLHEIGQVCEENSTHSTMCAADLCEKYQESDEVVHAIRSLHADVPASTLEAELLGVANRLSENRPGARKENLSVFIERLRRLEEIASRFPEVERAFAVKSGKEIRVLVNAEHASDDRVYALSRHIARAVEQELSYPGQVKVTVVRETRAVRYAL